MKIKGEEVVWKDLFLALLCIAAGTASGLILYWFFYVHHIAIFGWNLALIFAPLLAGAVETIMAKKLIGRDLGAISALILFVDTTVHSFILKNPTLGMNAITAGSIVVILQAAFPTLINYILMIVIGLIASALKWNFNTIKKIFGRGQPEKNDELIDYDEKESDEILNSLDFYFVTTPDMGYAHYEKLEFFESHVIIKNEDEIDIKEHDQIEEIRLLLVKKGINECLINLANQIKENGGNGVLDLTIIPGLVGLGGDHIHITATGMGINLNQEQQTEKHE
ncbi:hypothetical protein [Methanobrevibacter sp. YE315]|uniref:hypothetical protein n=1 Tax=Methanobrevibacter sp. YE315 TaxID=1609968 RepID=UPI000829E124|nr:hypothetical protein [Methanobrevibacter sp. YE315]